MRDLGEPVFLIDSNPTAENIAKLIFDFAAGGFRDFTRIASSNPEMWRDICLANRDALVQALTQIQDQTISGMRPHQICRTGIGRTYQIPRPFMNMSVFENLQVCAKPGKVDFRALLDLAGLWDKRNRLAKTLTFQERRLLELSRALAVACVGIGVSGHIGH